MKTDIAVRPALLLADDNPALLATLLGLLGSEYRVVASLTNGASVLEQVDLLNPDIHLLDISLGDLCGFDAARHLRDRPSRAKIIFLSFHEDVDFVTAGFDIGACGYIFKSRVVEDLRKAIEIVYAGGRFVSPTSSLRSVTHFLLTIALVLMSVSSSDAFEAVSSSIKR
jgi:two-component system nitrate/nitrite response regulator NarL